MKKPKSALLSFFRNCSNPSTKLGTSARGEPVESIRVRAKLNWGIGLLILPFLLDRVTKYLAIKFSFSDFHLAPFLSLNLEFNRGVSWSLFHSEDSVTFGVLSCVILIVILVLAIYSYNRFKLGYSVYGELLIISGAVSNFIDRLFYGGVADFIVLHFDKFYWPTFNFADAFIFVGVLNILVMSLKHE